MQFNKDQMLKADRFMCVIRILENVTWKWTGIIQARLNNADSQRKGGKVWKEAVAEGKELRKTERKWDRNTGGKDSWRRGKRESLCGRGRLQRMFLYRMGFLLPLMKYTTLIYSSANWSTSMSFYAPCSSRAHWVKRQDAWFTNILWNQE